MALSAKKKWKLSQSWSKQIFDKYINKSLSNANNECPQRTFDTHSITLWKIKSHEINCTVRKAIYSMNFGMIIIKFNNFYCNTFYWRIDWFDTQIHAHNLLENKRKIRKMYEINSNRIQTQTKLIVIPGH